MFLLDEPLDLITDDERLLVRRRDTQLGDNTVVVDGRRLHRGFAHEFDLRCNVQPVSGKELMQLGEGDRFIEQYWAYAADAEQPTQVNDLVYRPDDQCWYLVNSCENWGCYTKLRMELLDTGAWPQDEPDPLAEYDRRLLVRAQENG